METTPVTPGDYWEIVKRRKWSLVLSFVVVLFMAAAVAFLLPSIYRSTATILIEEQNIPADFVMTTVSTYAEQRLESIKQRIMSFSRLWSIINQFDLYHDIREKWTPEEVVDKMRDDIMVETINADMFDRRTGRPTAVTTAFTLSYEGKDPRAVLRVTDTLTSLFLEENLEVRQRQVTETSQFLSDEAKRIKSELENAETLLAQYKENNINELPELLQVNMQSLSNIERNIERLNSELRSLKEREGYLQAQIGNVSPYLETENQRMRDEQVLSDLKTQLSALRKRYSDAYPDVISLKGQIVDLEKRMQASPAVKTVAQGDTPNNPAYITMKSQMASVRAEIKSVRKQIRNFEAKANDYRTRIETTPRVEENYRSILTKRDSLQNKFDDLVRKHQEAKVAQELEKEQKGERFTLIEPARLPEKPYKPNRLAILLVGFILALGAAVGFAALREFSDQSIRNTEALGTLSRAPVLAIIPKIVTRREIFRKRLRRASVFVGVLLLIGGGVALFHYYVMDLDVFWARLMRRVARL